MGKVGDSEARKAAKTLKKYCDKHKHCDGCIFSTGDIISNCILADELPLDWIRQLDTLRG